MHSASPTPHMRQSASFTGSCTSSVGISSTSELIVPPTPSRRRNFDFRTGSPNSVSVSPSQHHESPIQVPKFQCIGLEKTASTASSMDVPPSWDQGDVFSATLLPFVPPSGSGTTSTGGLYPGNSDQPLIPAISTQLTASPFFSNGQSYHNNADLSVANASGSTTRSRLELSVPSGEISAFSCTATMPVGLTSMKSSMAMSIDGTNSNAHQIAITASFYSEKTHTALKPSTTTLPPRLPNVPELGVNLTPVHIAHNKNIQRLMDHRRISWGVQWAIARGITQGLWGWEDVTPEKLDMLKGSCAEAAMNVEDVILSRETSLSTSSASAINNVHTMNAGNELSIWFVCCVCVCINRPLLNYIGRNSIVNKRRAWRIRAEA